MKHLDYIAIGLILWAVWWYVDANQGSGSTGLGSNFVSVWAQAIAVAENVNPAYNNPGGLDIRGDAGSTPAAEGAGQIIGIFSSLQAGYTALENTLNTFVAKYGNHSLIDATAIYILGPNNPAIQTGDYPASVWNEANVVAAGLGGVSLDTTISSLAGGN